MKFELTITLTYDVDPEDYAEDQSPQEMVDSDVAAADDSPESFLAAAWPYQCKVTGKVLEE